MDEYAINIGKLRKLLMDEAYAGPFSGLGATILDVGEIKRAPAEELLEIANRCSVK